jgi:taurine dioxygenase
MVIQINALSDALGAEVVGADLSQPMDEATKAQMTDALHRHHLLCIRSEPLSSADFARVARTFGEPQMQLLRKRLDAEVPEVSILESTYKTAKDKPDDLTKVRLSGWHTDDSYFQTPAKITMLQSIEVPESGGQTKFANTRQAFEDLPDAKRAHLAALKAVHSYDTSRAKARAIKLTAEEEAETEDAIHPLVRTHDESGVKAIYFNPNRTDHILEMPRAESDALLDELYQHMTQPQYQYHHEWRRGDLLVWDNRCLLHAVNTDYPVGQTRKHQRILLKGTRPV